MQATPRRLRVDIWPKQINQHVPWRRSATLSKEVTDDPRRLGPVPTLDQLTATEQTETAEEADTKVHRTGRDGWAYAGLHAPPDGSLTARAVDGCDVRSIRIREITRSSRRARRFGEPGKRPKEHVEGATRVALGGERLLVRQPVLIEVMVLQPPTSRHLLSSDHDREEGPITGDLGMQRSQLLHDFRWADVRKPGEDVVNRTMQVRGGLITRRSRSHARYPIPGNQHCPESIFCRTSGQWFG